MGREIRYPDGTVRHIYAGPAARPWWRRHLAGVALMGLLVVSVVLAHLGGR